MEAIVLRSFGPPENLKYEMVPEPDPGPKEVLLKVHACGVCFHDVINRRGNLPRTKVPAILGHEVAGEVVALGPGVEGWSPGDRAATLQRLSCGTCRYCHDGRNSLCKSDARFFGEEIPGGYAAYMVAPVAGLGKVTVDVPWEVAATTCCTTGTAVHTVRTRGKVQDGETVIITGASGGVGMQALQLARYDGAQVIAVTTSATKVAMLKEAGAHHVIVSPDLGFSKKVRKITDGGADVALEIVGSITLLESLRSLAPGGRLITIGNLETVSALVNPGLLIVKELQILGAYGTTQEELQEALRLIASDILKPWISDTLPLKDASRAHLLLEKRTVTGRLVLIPKH